MLSPPWAAPATGAGPDQRGSVEQGLHDVVGMLCEFLQWRGRQRRPAGRHVSPFMGSGARSKERRVSRPGSSSFLSKTEHSMPTYHHAPMGAASTFAQPMGEYRLTLEACHADAART